MKREKNGLSVGQPFRVASSKAKTLPYGQNGTIDKRIDYAILLSITIHILLFFLFSHAKKVVRNYADLKQITFIDQTYRPEVAKLLPKVPTGITAGTAKGIQPETPTLAPSQQPINQEGAIDFESKLDRSQALIDLNRYELNRTSDELNVIRIGNQANGSQKTTEEILLEKPVQLSKGLSRGDGLPGITGYPGVYQEPAIKIEHKEIDIPRKTTIPQTAVSKQTQPEPTLNAIPIRGTNIQIAGPISQRAILSKVLPQYPQWALTRGIAGTVIIRLWVLPDGTVKETITIEQSSGYPDLDQTVINALRRWKFAPLDKSVTQEIQWGVITFRFTLT